MSAYFEARRHAQQLTANGRHKEALPYWQQALQIGTQELGAAHQFTLHLRGCVAQCLTELGRHEEVLPY